jgi:DNA-binding CsgD family transcriptional regulator
LEQRGADPSILVYHALEAGDSDALVAHAPQAARRATEAGSRREAAAHYRAIEPLLDRFPPGEGARLIEEWAMIEGDLGHIALKLALLQRAMDLHEEIGDGVSLALVRQNSITSLWMTKRNDDALRVATEVVSELEQAGATTDQVAMALVDMAFVNVLADNFDATVEAIAAARELTSPGSEADVVARAVEVWIETDPESAIEMGEEAIQAAGAADSVRALDLAYSGMLLQCVLVHPSRRGDVIDRAIAFAEEHGLEERRAFYLMTQADCELLAGQLGIAEDIGHEIAAVWSDLDINLALAAVQTIALAQVRKGAPLAAEWIEKLYAIPDRLPPVNYGAEGLMAEAHWLDENSPFDVNSAIREYDYYEDYYQRSGLVDLDAAYSLFYWLWKLDVLSEAPAWLPRAYRLQVEGDWRRAAETWAYWERPYEQALALADGDVPARLAALRILDDMGAVPLAARIRRELRRDGVKNIPLGPRPSTRERVANLTTRQSEVLDLMAQGQTNAQIADRLFISSRTAEHHVAAILSKLNASSRDEAVTIARGLGVVADPH